MEERIYEEWYVGSNRDNVIPFPGTCFGNGEVTISGAEQRCKIERHFRRKIRIKLLSLLRSGIEFAGFAAAFAYIMYQVFNWLMYV